MEKEFNSAQITAITGPVTFLTIFDRDRILQDILNRASVRRTGKEYFVIHYATGSVRGTLSGHWVAMIINYVTRKIYWYDSYGIFPDNQVNFIDDNFRRESDQDERYYGQFLYLMMRRYGYKVDYNNQQVQKLQPGINTCGRYVALFILLNKSADYPPQEFNKLLGRYINGNVRSYDQAIVEITRNIR